MIKLIAFDLDNVLIDGEAIDEIAKLADAESEVSEITQKAMEGNLDFETALKQRVALLKGTSVEEINKVVQEIPIMEGAEETIAELKNRGYKIATISGSFENIAQRLKDLLDLDYAFSNTLEENEGLLTGEVSGPLVVGSKADVLAEIISNEKISSEEMFQYDALTCPINLVGNCAISIPCGNIQGVPVGMQIACDKFQDEKMLQIARAVEKLN